MTLFIRSVVAALPILLLLGVPAQAATYYVSPSGSDSNSCATAQSNTTGQQKRTIAAGVVCLMAGDTLYIRGGTYTGALNVIDSSTYTVRSGTSWTKAVTIAGYPGETVILQPPSNVSAVKLKMGDPAYVIVQDLTLDMVNSASVPNGEGASAAFISNGAHHNRLLRVVMKNGGGHGLQIYGWGSHNEVVQCHIHHNGTPSQGFNQAYGMYVTTSDNLIDGNDIHDNNGYGLHFYNASGATVNRNVIRNNKIYDNGTGGGTNYGVVVARGSDNQIYNNLIYRNRGGILVYTNAGNTQVFNNTVYQNTPLEGIALQYYASAPTVRNNIVFSNGAGVVNHGGTGTPVTTNNLTADPKFVNAAANDFRLQQGSAAEDAGATVTSVRTDYAGVSRPQGSAYDIGAHERQRGGGPPSAPRKLKIVGP